MIEALTSQVAELQKQVGAADSTSAFSLSFAHGWPALRQASHGQGDASQPHRTPPALPQRATPSPRLAPPPWQVADRDGWLAGNATAAARAAQRWARWVAGNRTQVAARWAGWLAGNVTELEQQLNSGGDGGEGEGGQGEGSATVELAALQAELDACEAAYQAAAEANATCTAWELPALEAERDECLQAGASGEAVSGEGRGGRCRAGAGLGSC